jgi:hypothetical protein
MTSWFHDDPPPPPPARRAPPPAPPPRHGFLKTLGFFALAIAAVAIWETQENAAAEAPRIFKARVGSG